MKVQWGFCVEQDLAICKKQALLHYSNIAKRVECSHLKLHRNHDEPIHILFNWFLSERVSLSTFYLIVKHTSRAGNAHLIVRDSHFNIPATWNSHHIYWQSSVKIINFLFHFCNCCETLLKPIWNLSKLHELYLTYFRKSIETTLKNGTYKLTIAMDFPASLISKWRNNIET